MQFPQVVVTQDPVGSLEARHMPSEGCMLQTFGTAL